MANPQVPAQAEQRSVEEDTQPNLPWGSLLDVPILPPATHSLTMYGPVTLNYLSFFTHKILHVFFAFLCSCCSAENINNSTPRLHTTITAFHLTLLVHLTSVISQVFVKSYLYARYHAGGWRDRGNYDDVSALKELTMCCGADGQVNYCWQWRLRL